MGRSTRWSGKPGKDASRPEGLARSLFDPYRPELHYMRGPGPKWHAKHDRAPARYPTYDAVPALVRVRVKG